METSLVQVIYSIRVQVSRLERLVDRFSELDRMLFERLLAAQRSGDVVASAGYAGEIAGIRRTARGLVMASNVLAALVPELERLYVTRDRGRAGELAALLEEIRRHLPSDPELAAVMLEAVEALKSMAGIAVAEDGYGAVERARRMVEKAVQAADDWMQKHFPPLPSALPK